MSQTLVVAFAPLRSCLVNLPGRWAAALAAQPASKECMVFRLSWGAASSAYVGWSGGVSSGGAGSLEIDGMFARQLGLADGARVGVSYVADVATCTAAAVEPASADDWEILSLNAGAVEERLLQQARVVAVGQPIVFWLSASTVVRLATASVTPSAHACCLLANDTEVIVAPRTRTRTHARPGGTRSNIVCCLRVAAHAAVAEGVVYASTESPIIQLRGSSVRVGRAMPSIDSSHSSSSSAPSAGVPCESAWAVARLEASDGVQPGVLLAAPAMLRAAGLAAGELVRVVQDTGGDKDKKDAEEKEEEKEEKEEEKKEVVEEVAGMDAFLDDAWRSIDSALAAGGSGGGLLVCGRRGSGKTSVARALARRASASASAQAMRLRLVYAQHIDCAALALEPRAGQAAATVRAAARAARASAPALLVLDDIDALVPAASSEHGDDRRARRMAEALVDALLGCGGGGGGGGVAVLATAAARASIHARVLGAGVFAAVREIPAPRAAERELMLAAIARTSAAPPAPGASFAAAAYATEGCAPADLRAVYARAAQEAARRALLTSGSSSVAVHVTGDGEGEVMGVAGDGVAAEAIMGVTSTDIERALVGFQPLALRGVTQTGSVVARWADIGGLGEARRLVRETLALPSRYAAVFARSPLRLRSGVLLYGFPGCGKTLLAGAAARECGLRLVATKGAELLSKYIGSSEQAVRALFRRAAAAAPCVLFFDEFDALAPRRGHDSTGVTDRVVNQLLTEMDGAEGLAGVFVLAASSRPDLVDPALLRPGRLDKAVLCPLPGPADRADILARHAARLRADRHIDWPALAARAEHFSGADLQALVYNAFLAAVHSEIENSEATGSSPTSALPTPALPAEFAAIGGNKALLASPAERAKLAERLIRLIHSTSTNIDDRQIQQQEQLDSRAKDRVPVVTMAHFDAAFASTHASLTAADRERFAAIYRAFANSGKKSAVDKQPSRVPIEQRATLA